MGNIQDSWNDILENLRNEYNISDLAFSTWIKPLSIRKAEGNKLTIVVPGEQIGVDYVTRKYSLPLKVSIADVTGQETDIVFISEDDFAVKEAPEEKEFPVPYTFDTFVVGNNNKFAHAAALAVSENPGTLYNPLFLYGGVGLGKTHLMHAIAHNIKQNHPEKKILYVAAVDFMNQIVEALHPGSGNNTLALSRFRDKYRNIDVLLIDDIQFIIGKEATQEEFFHTFNALYEDRKQIVISSDRAPKEMTLLDERFRSRFEWGLMADIQSPDYETRVAILRKKQELEGVSVPDDVVDYIASNVKSNIRELEGSLNKIIATADLLKCDITLDLVKHHLSDFITPDEKKKITPQSIMAEVCRYFNVSEDDIRSTKRSSKIAFPRQIVMYLIKEMTDSTLQQIGEIVGGKDHTTVLYGINKIEESLKDNAKTQETVKTLKENISL